MGAVRALLWRWRDRWRPGTLIAHLPDRRGLERFLVEFVRRNDDVLLGLTQPQLVSVAMMLAGGAWLPVLRRGADARRPPAPPARGHNPIACAACTPRPPPSTARLRIGGCDAVELAREFGTPAYVVAEDDLRARAREFRGAGRATRAGEVVFASKAFPCTAVLRVFAEEGLGCDVASGGELRSRCAPASTPSGSTCTATRSPRPSCALALEAGVGTIVVDNVDELDRLERARRRRRRRAGSRHARRRGDTHAHDPHRPGRLEVRLRSPTRARSSARRARSTSPACTCTSARSSRLEPFRPRSRRSPRSATSTSTTSAAASASPTRRRRGGRRRSTSTTARRSRAAHARARHRQARS